MNEIAFETMDKERLKLITRNLEILVNSLKAELYSDIPIRDGYEEIKQVMSYDYDEIFYDEEDEK